MSAAAQSPAVSRTGGCHRSEVVSKEARDVSIADEAAVVHEQGVGALAAVSAAGIVGLAVTAVVGFEEPNNALSLTSFVLMLVAPVATSYTWRRRELTSRERRIWIRQFAGPRAPRAFSAYLTSHDRSATAERLAAEALTRSHNDRTREP